MESILQNRLQDEDFAIAEAMVKEIYRHKIYGKEKYAQLMRVLPYIVRQKERASSKLIDNTDVPILFKFLRDHQEGEDDDGDDIWFNISTPIDSALCEQNDLQRFKTQDYLKLQGYITSDLYQGEDEELFLIKQFKLRNENSNT